ncbi:hypothetical protein PHMEG_00018322 [Phytophthora megakarya]|uniref:RNase H type-1 domain-containing protein n=1 Tax=Phytophthora megakarya TaxID=4795 RepID=A0A225VUA6_9STRA|nr:hypothetical protein PHMEG_00018322 [Phytophthora megakarya]
MNYHSAEKKVLDLVLLLKVCYTLAGGKDTASVHPILYTLMGPPIQVTLWTSSAVCVQRVGEGDCVFTQLIQSTITNFVDLDGSLALVARPTKGSPTTRLDPSLLYVQLPHDYEGFVVSFDDSPKTEKNCGYGICSWIVWTLPEWPIVTAASAYLEQTTVNMAEYSGMIHGVIATVEQSTEDLAIVGVSRLTIHQSLGVIASRKNSLMILLNRHRELVAKLKPVRYLHVVREYNAAADSLAGEALESKVSNVVLNDHRKAELKELNRIQEMIYEPSSDDIKVENTDGGILLQHKTSADFAHQEHAEALATTRRQTKTKKKRVHFEDEVPEGATTPEAAEASTEDSETQVQ